MTDKDFENPATGHLWGVEVKLKKVGLDKKKTVMLPSDEGTWDSTFLFSPFNFWRSYASEENEYKKQEAKDAYNAKIRELDNLGYKHPFQLIVEN